MIMTLNQYRPIGRAVCFTDVANDAGMAAGTKAGVAVGAGRLTNAAIQTWVVCACS